MSWNTEMANTPPHQKGGGRYLQRAWLKCTSTEPLLSLATCYTVKSKTYKADSLSAIWKKIIGEMGMYPVQGGLLTVLNWNVLKTAAWILVKLLATVKEKVNFFWKVERSKCSVCFQKIFKTIPNPLKCSKQVYEHINCKSHFHIGFK